MSSQFNPTSKHKQTQRARLKLEELENRTVPSSASAVAVQTGQYAENHIIVQWNDAAPVSTPLSTSLQAIGNNTYDVYLQSGVTVSQAISYYSSLSGVAYAEPDYTLALEGSPVTPNNPDYSSQWSLTAINAPEAWGVTTGSNNIIVAVIDTGIDYNQPDLVNNLWHNTDGSVGWNFINNNNNPYDYDGHGTAVAGIIGAEGNSGIGVAGVDWNVKLMALQFMDSTGSGSTSNAAAAIYWAVQHGAQIINASWGGTASDSALASAISYAQQHGVIVVTAAGDNGTNNDTTSFYPADYSYNNLVAVAATDQNGNLASYSDYGAKSVALAAPGSDILTTTPNDTYTYYSGTSMAAAEVTGAMALVWGEHPTWAYTQVIAAVLDSVDPMSSLTGKVSTGGELDLYKAVTYGETPTPTPTPTPSTSSSVTGLTISSTSVSEYKPTGTVVGTLSASDTASGIAVTYSLVSGSGSTNNNLFAIVGNQLETAAIFDYSTQSSYSIRVCATDENGNTYDEVVTINILNVSALVRNGTTLTIDGTSGNDKFSFLGGATDVFALDGVTYAASSAVISKFVFNGAGGNDIGYLKGSGTLSLGMTPTFDIMTGSSFTVVLQNVSTVVAWGNSNGTASLYDGAGNNTFVGTPTCSYLQGANYDDCVCGFQTVAAYETAGSYDTAYEYDGSGSNTFVGAATYSYLQGSNFMCYAGGFQAVVAQETSGSSDTAYLYDGSGTNTFVGTASYSYFQGNNFINYAYGFQVVVAQETSGSSDTAYLYDGSGTNTFVGTAGYSYFQGSNFINFAYGFQEVWAFATSGNDDTAFLYDAPGVNVFEGQGSDGYVDANGIICGVSDFGQVYLYSMGSNQDSVAIGTLAYTLYETGAWS